MSILFLNLFAFLIIQVSCEGKGSLTFIIDDTASSIYEINAVKSAAKSIVDTVLSNNSKLIEDIVVVTFNDPAFKFRTRTKDVEVFRKTLDSIEVGGGSDCPEMALSGIKKGLEESRPGSYLYVFTDASAKDYNMLAEIKTLCQDKQSQISFILTGHCGDRDKESYQVYEKIAAACNGQSFQISRNEVAQVLEYLKETIKDVRTKIAPTIVPANTWRDVQVDINDGILYAIVSATGSNVNLTVIDQDTKIAVGERITWTNNVKVLKLANLSSGIYTARVRGDSEVNIVVSRRMYPGDF